MSKLVSFISLLFFQMVAFSQSEKVKMATDYYQQFLDSKKFDYIQKAKSLISEEMKIQDAQKNDWNNYYQANILKVYNENAIDTAFSLDNYFKSIELFKKTLQINPKFIDKETVINSLKFLGYDLYKTGIDFYNKKDNQNAYLAYKELASLYDYLLTLKSDFSYTDANKQTSTISPQDINNNLLVFTINAGKEKEAIELLKKELVATPTPSKYLQLSQLAAQSGDTIMMQKYIEEASVKYPENIDILIGSINNAVASNNNAVAIQKLEKAIVLDPKNQLLYAYLGQLYSDTKNISNAKKIYQKGLELFPDDYNLNYGLAGLNYNLAAELYESKDKSKSYLPLFEEAKKYFNKCQSIQPNKNNIDKFLNI